MLAKPRRSRRTVTVLVVLVLLSVTIITVDQTGKFGSLTSGARSVASDVFSPIRSGVNAIVDPIGRFFAGAVHYGALQRENEQLQAEIGALEQHKTQAATVRAQLAALQKLEREGKLPALAGITTVLTEVTAHTVSDLAATVTIDKGRDNGVQATDPVIGAGGLVGQVAIAYRGSAVVRLITDGKSAVGVTYGNNEQATLDGTGAGKALAAAFVPSATTVHVGTLMATSNLSGATFPAGIPVARVASVHKAPGATSKQVTARPVADLANLTFLMVLQWGPGA